MRRALAYGVGVTAVFAMALTGTSCWDSGRSEAESPAYENGRFSDDYDWDFQRTVTLDLDLAEALRPVSGAARVEVRHTVYGGPVLFQGTLSEANAWARRLTTRLPQHETALSVTVETSQGLTRQIVPIGEDGLAQTVFQ